MSSAMTIMGNWATPTPATAALRNWAMSSVMSRGVYGTLALAASGDLVPVIDRVYPLDEADSALVRIDDGGVVGKVLVSAID